MYGFAFFLVSLLFACPASGQGYVSPAKYWLKRYPVHSFSEHWTLTIAVKDPAAAQKKAAAVLGSSGGRPHLPVSGMAGSRRWGQQQLSFALMRSGAEKAIKKIEKSGKILSKKQRKVYAEADLSEARSKLGRLRTERVAGKATIDRFGSIAALADELIEHLEGVVSVGEKSKNRVLLNLIFETERQ